MTGKICTVFERFPETASQNLLELVRIMTQMGFYLRIVSLHRAPRGDASPDRLSLEIFRLPLCLTEFLLAPLVLLMLLMIAPLKAIKAFCILLKCLIVFPDRLRVIKNYLQAALLVNVHILDKEITHLHGQASPEAARVTFFAATMSGLSTSFSALPFDISRPGFGKLKKIIMRADFILTASRYDQEYIAQKILGDAPIIPSVLCFFNGIDLDVFHFRGLESDDATPPVRFFTAACLNRKKGIDTVIRALRILKDANIDFEYLIAGDGPERENLEQLAAELDLSGMVKFLGNLSRHEIPKLLHSSDMFLITPRILESGERDSAPAGIIEAMAVGVPVIASDIAGVPEIVEADETGLLVPPDNPEELAKACRRLIDEPELRDMIIMKARLHVEGSCDIVKQAERFNEFIRNHNIFLCMA